MLPSNLVYFGRAGVLVEGIGLRYDPNFNALAMARPVLSRAATRLVQGVLEQDPRARLTDWTQEALATVRTLRDLVRRVERDELRVRWHPRDALELQRFLAQQVRRALLAIFAFTIAVITSVIYLATRRLEVLVAGPAARLRNVLRHLPACPRTCFRTRSASAATGRIDDRVAVAVLPAAERVRRQLVQRAARPRRSPPSPAPAAGDPPRWPTRLRAPRARRARSGADC